VRFLGPDWLAAVAAAAGEVRVDEPARLHVAQVVTGGPDGEVAYTVHLSGGRMTVAAGAADDVDVTFTCDYPTAAALSRGERSAQDAFMAGTLRVGGDVGALLAAADALQRLGDVFAGVRDETEY
jgi:putative sterol carrier protein